MKGFGVINNMLAIVLYSFSKTLLCILLFFFSEQCYKGSITVNEKLRRSCSVAHLDLVTSANSSQAHYLDLLLLPLLKTTYLSLVVYLFRYYLPK